MATQDLIVAYKANIDTVIGNQTAPSSVTEDTVATAYKDLADILNGVVGGAITADYDTLLKVGNKVQAIEAIVGNADPDGDSLVDKVAEILTVFATYPEGMDILTVLNTKYDSDDVANDLTTLVAGKILDARQGKALLDMITPKADKSYVDTQDAAISLTITNLKAGSTETIASLKASIDAKPTTAYVDGEIDSTIAIIDALKNGSAETIASLATSINTLNAIVGSSAPDADAFADTVTEILAVFSTYPEGVDLLNLIGSKVNITDIVNTLTEVGTGKVLDARQGKILKDLVDGKQAQLVAGVNIKTLDGESILGAGDRKTIFTHAQYAVLTDTEKIGRKTIRDTQANLEAANAIYPIGWLIFEIQGAGADKIKEADGQTVYKKLYFGITQDLLNLFDPEEAYEFNTANLDGAGDPIKGVRFRNSDSNALKLFRRLGFGIKAETLLAKYHEAFSSTMSSNASRFTWLLIEKPITITEMMVNVKTAGVFDGTGKNNNMSLYKVDVDTRIATLVGNTANDETIWKTAGLAKRPLITPVVCEEGLYLVGVRYEALSATTVPTISVRSLDGVTQSVFENVKLVYTMSTVLPATIDTTTGTQSSVCHWMGVN